MDNQKRHAPSENPKAPAPGHAARPGAPKAAHAKPAAGHAAKPAARPAVKQAARPAGKASSKKRPAAQNKTSVLARTARSVRAKAADFFRQLPPIRKVFAGIGGFFARLWKSLSARVRALPFRWPLYAGGAALVLAVVLLIVLLPAKPDRVVAAPPVTAATEAPAFTAAPAVTPEPTATPEPTPTPKPEALMSAKYKVLKGIPNTNKALGLPKCAQVDHSYFNDTVFIGDSISEKLHLFVTKMRKTYPDLLGNAKFITTPSLSSRNALKPVSETSLHPTVRGKKMPIEDAVALSGAKKVYVMLGMNDVGITGVNQSAKDLFTLLRKIKDKSPDIQIFVQSATPRLKGDKPTTEQLFKYNLKVYEYCLKYTDYDIYFVDVAYAMRNKYGNLTSAYCSDPHSMAIHFTDEGCKKWIQYLYTHALV